MKQEDKDLLLRDLCARLPYQVKCNIGENIPYTLCRIGKDDMNGHLLDFIETKNGLDVQVYLSECKPYLFPLSSMTEEQRKECYDIVKYKLHPINQTELTDWYHKNHIDYRGLIPLGLANDATNLNIY